MPSCKRSLGSGAQGKREERFMGDHQFGRNASRLAALGSVLALGAGFVACGGSDESSSGGGGGGGDVTVGLITKTETNPFFVKMKEGAQSQAKKLGAEVQS